MPAPPPPPPAPTFNPFANDPAPPAEETPTPEAPPVPEITPAPPPPPPAPTFNPFENDPLPPTPSELPNEAPLSTKENNPLDEVNPDTNQTSVPLENIFNTPPPDAAPADNFNPFDLPAEN